MPKNIHLMCGKGTAEETAEMQIKEEEEKNPSAYTTKKRIISSKRFDKR